MCPVNMPHTDDGIINDRALRSHFPSSWSDTFANRTQFYWLHTLGNYLWPLWENGSLIRGKLGCVTSKPAGACPSWPGKELVVPRKPNILSTMSESLTGSVRAFSICSTISFFLRASSFSFFSRSASSLASWARRSWRKKHCTRSQKYRTIQYVSRHKCDDELLLSTSLLCFTDVLNVVTCYICSPGVCVQPQLSLSLQTSGSSVWLLQPDASSRPPASSGTERRNEGVHHQRLNQNWSSQLPKHPRHSSRGQCNFWMPLCFLYNSEQCNDTLRPSINLTKKSGEAQKSQCMKLYQIYQALDFVNWWHERDLIISKTENLCVKWVLCICALFCVCVYLCLQPLVQSSSDHSSRVGLDGDDGPQPVPECSTHQEAATATLEGCDSLTGHVIRCAQLPGTNQSLKTRKASSHLKVKRRKVQRVFALILFCFHFVQTAARCSQLHSSSCTDILSTSSGSALPTSSTLGSWIWNWK